jgi:hypothetical protein
LIVDSGRALDVLPEFPAIRDWPDLHFHPPILSATGNSRVVGDGADFPYPIGVMKRRAGIL